MLKKQLLQAQKMESIGNLAGGIAHDFNNILSPILGYSQMLMQDYRDGGIQYQKVQNIHQAGLRASKLVKQILTLSRQSNHEVIPVRLERILREALKLSRSTIPNSIKLSHEFDENCGAVAADPTQIHQVAMNLITNAYHAVDECGGEILITLKQVRLENGELIDGALPHGDYVMFSVKDNGIGISAENLERIFDPYFTTKDSDKGTGLGLSIVYGIVKEHGGELKVSSVPGAGTLFNIYLPLISHDDSNPSSAHASKIPTGSGHVLLVDDEPLIVTLYKDMVESLGYKVTCFHDSVAALQAFIDGPYHYDLIITDYTMPDLTGIQFAKKIISTRDDIPILMCTGVGTIIDRKEVSSSGIRKVLIKPVLIEELGIALQNELPEQDPRTYV